MDRSDFHVDTKVVPYTEIVHSSANGFLTILVFDGPFFSGPRSLRSIPAIQHSEAAGTSASKMEFNPEIFSVIERIVTELKYVRIEDPMMLSVIKEWSNKKELSSFFQLWEFEWGVVGILGDAIVEIPNGVTPDIKIYVPLGSRKKQQVK